MPAHQSSLKDWPLDRALLAALAPGVPVSGAQLASRLSVTRAALWKHVAELRTSGLPIEARSGVGYCLPWPTQLLDEEEILRGLRHPAQAPVRVVWELDSTQNELARQQDEWPDLSVVLCERQTSGRGRRGRQWRVPPALSICLSCLKRFLGGPATLSGLSIAVGVCVVRALASLGVRGLHIKWPNDVMTDDGKLSGILIEVSGEAEGPSVVRIGIGLNVRLPPEVREAVDQPAADLAMLCHGVPPDRNQLAAALIQALRDGLQCFEVQALQPFRDEFEALDSLHDKPLLLHAPGGVRHGVGRGIDGSGALLVEMEGTVVPVYSGEVSVRAAG